MAWHNFVRPSAGRGVRLWPGRRGFDGMSQAIAGALSKLTTESGRAIQVSRAWARGSVARDREMPGARRHRAARRPQYFRPADLQCLVKLTAGAAKSSSPCPSEAGRW